MQIEVTEKWYQPCPPAIARHATAAAAGRAPPREQILRRSLQKVRPARELLLVEQEIAVV